MYTRILRPNLASQAPKDRRIILMVGRLIWVIYIRDGINRTNLNIIPSRHSNDISRCVRCDKSAITVA
jgi:hypothetical protein